MIELIWVIVILGIMAAIAVPKFAATRDDAKIAKARSTVASVQSGIVTERQTRLFRGDSSWAASLEGADAGSLFDAVMQYGVSGNGWTNPSAGRYLFTLGGDTATFDYNTTTGTFDCDNTEALCNKLTN